MALKSGKPRDFREKSIKYDNAGLFISAVIAAYNEAGNVVRLFQKIAEVLRREKIQFEIIGMIDGDDGSFESLEKLKKNHNLKELRLYYGGEKPSGLGNAYRKGFNLVNPKTTHVLTMDADWNHNPEEFPGILAKMIETKADITIGSRHTEGGRTSGIPLWKRLLSGIINSFFNVITRVQAKDKTSGYRLYTKEAVELVKNEYVSVNFDFLPEILILAERKKLRISEAPILFTYRKVGKSKMFMVKTAKGYLRLIYRLVFGKMK
jgi:dolichol-phosphate mannosyltransferase